MPRRALAGRRARRGVGGAEHRGGAELLLSAGDERNEAIHEAIQKIEGAPDLCLESHFEYGARVGYWRICELTDHYGVPLTLQYLRPRVEGDTVGR